MPPVMSGSIRVNVTTAVNHATIRRETRNGKDVIIVPSATLPDDIVMNNIKYPASEIEKSFKSLDRTFAPLGHPMIGNNYVSATEPEAVNNYYIGAHNENVRRENGRVFLDKVIDIEVANRTEGGKALLDAINAGKPIDTSTGIFLELDASNDAGYSYIAKNMVFDHDAILINEEGAARPSQGVGMMVNSDGVEIKAQYKGNLITAVNSILDQYDENIEYAAKYLFEAIESRDRASKAQSFIDKIMALLGIKSDDVTTEASGLNNNHDNEEINMSVTKEQFDSLAEEVKSLKANASDIAKTVSDAIAQAIAPLNDTIASLQATNKAIEDAERAALVSKVVANGLLDESTANGLAVNALRQLAEKSKVGAAAPVFNGGFAANANDEWAGYDLNAAGDK